MSLTLRSARPEDAARCGTICYEAFRTISEQHRFPPDFPSPEAATGLIGSLVPRPDVYSIVAELDGKVVGSNFLWDIGAVAGIGPITVDPEVQNASVGKKLMEDVLAHARTRGFPAVRLVQAAFHGRSLSLYTKLGFEVREPLSMLHGPPLGLRTPGRDVRAATASDLEACNGLCRRVHGHDRGTELAQAIGQGSATLVEHAGRVTGYATMIGFFGHAVGETNTDLQALLGAAPAIAGPGLLLPSRNGELFRWCLAQGLRVVQPLTLMSLGLYGEPRGAFLPSILF